MKATFDAHAKSIDFDGSLERAAEHQKAGGLRERLNRFADAVANGLGPIERLGAQPKVEASLPPSMNPRDLLSYMKASDYTVRTFLNDGVVDPVSRELVGPSFKSMFEPFGNDTDAIKRALTFVKAQRDVGRGLAGVAGDEAALARAHAVVDYGRTVPQLQTFARDWQQFVDGVGQYAVKSGLWTPELWERMQASDALYVPYRRIRGMTAKEIGEGLRAGPNSKRVANVGPGIDRFEGSRKAIANPAEAMAEYAGAIVRRADRYRIGAALFDAAAALGPEGDFLLTPIKPADVPASLRGSVAADMRAKAEALGIDPEALAELENTFDLKFDKENPVIWRNGADGQRQYAQVNSPDLWRAISAMNANDGRGIRAILDVTVRPLKRVFVATTTALNPRFALGTNPVRDAIDAVAKTRAGVTPMDIGRGYYEAIKDLAHRSPVASEADRFGLGNTSMYTNEVRPRAFVRDQAPTSTSDLVRSRVANAAALPIKTLERAAEVSDKGPRLAEYLKTLTKYDYKVALGEWSPADLRLRAATNGRAVTLDFANKPGNVLLRAAADYVPFFGPAMQAPVSLARAAAENPVRVASVSASVALMACIAWALKHQLPADQLDELNDRPANERAGFLFFPLDANRHMMRVPIGQELGLVAAGVTAGLDGLMDDDPHAGRLLQQAFVRALPPGIGELAQGDLAIPVPGVEQIIENGRNRRDYGGRPIVPRSLQGRSPAERRRDDTNPTYDALAAGVRGLGFDQFSPLEAENLVRGVTSSATPMLTAVTDPIASQVMGRKIPRTVDRGSPLNPATALFKSGPPSSTESETEYYDLRQRVNEAVTDMRAAMKSKDPRMVEGLRSRVGYLEPFVRRGFELADKELERVSNREQIVHRVFDAGEIDNDRAVSVLDDLRAQRQLIYRNATRILRDRIAGSLR